MECDSKKEIAQQITDKIVEGLEESFNRLLERKIKNDESFAFTVNGRVVQLRAQDYAKGSGTPNPQ